jgi:hypothetical protein
MGFDSGFSRYGYTTNGAPFWSLIQRGDAKGSMNLETTGGITEQSAYCLRLDVESVGKGRFGVANEGFFGIGVQAGGVVSAVVLCPTRRRKFSGPVFVRLENAKGEPLFRGS